MARLFLNVACLFSHRTPPLAHAVLATDESALVQRASVLHHAQKPHKQGAQRAHSFYLLPNGMATPPPLGTERVDAAAPQVDPFYCMMNPGQCVQNTVNTVIKETARAQYQAHGLMDAGMEAAAAKVGNAALSATAAVSEHHMEDRKASNTLERALRWEKSAAQEQLDKVVRESQTGLADDSPDALSSTAAETVDVVVSIVQKQLEKAAGKSEQELENSQSKATAALAQAEHGVDQATEDAQTISDMASQAAERSIDRADMVAKEALDSLQKSSEGAVKVYANSQQISARKINRDVIQAATAASEKFDIASRDAQKKIDEFQTSAESGIKRMVENAHQSIKMGRAVQAAQQTVFAPYAPKVYQDRANVEESTIEWAQTAAKQQLEASAAQAHHTVQAASSTAMAVSEKVMQSVEEATKMAAAQVDNAAKQATSSIEAAFNATRWHLDVVERWARAQVAAEQQMSMKVSGTAQDTVHQATAQAAKDIAEATANAKSKVAAKLDNAKKELAKAAQAAESDIANLTQTAGTNTAPTS
eukprot:gnl/TRDRNA2_/TRDRNA2_36822_c0_seq1.p1 gnl/TRDRNA2_/TRDRNA2_36822_c0~~gnl/TRDRNA2_/TRDRNA2_36822_c0_seq1.p1  ORF type:complete len:534 (-),score=139.07 gnl/TRDRNA2_/TRDRNA2_36822_c0_seq1:37-1638(-)